MFVKNDGKATVLKFRMLGRFMRHFGTYVALALLVGGLLFFGQGLTGYVTSQTCCLPPSCPEEYLCSAAPQLARTHEATGDARLGLLLAFAGVTVFITHELSVHEEKKTKKE